MQIIKVPGINAFGRTNGCREAGNVIINELKNIWTNEKGKTIDVEKLDLEEIHLDNKDLKEQEKLIYENSKEIILEQDKVIFLGGDHSISYSLCKSFFEYCKTENEKPFLIIFDAHPDCMPPELEPSHESWLRALIEAGFSSENILIIGLRNSDIQEIKFLEENKIKQLSINEINNNIEEATDTITEFSKGNPLYISFDIDIVDPAFAPSTGYLEPGGLTSRQAIYIMSRLSRVKNLKCLDVVEVDIEKDKKTNFITSKLAAKIVAEFL